MTLVATAEELRATASEDEPPAPRRGRPLSRRGLRDAGEPPRGRLVSAYPRVCHVCGRSSAPVVYPPPGTPGLPACADHTPAAQLAVAERVLGSARVARLRANRACAEDVIGERREYIHAHWITFEERERLARDLVAKVLAS